jgi:hypothetical protein
MKNKNIRKHYRQGDVLVERVDSFPSDIKPMKRENGRVVLAHGEVTGHHHSIADRKVAQFDSQTETGVTFLDIAESLAALTHQEHATIPLPKGLYKVVIQREYQPKALPRRVAD